MADEAKKYSNGIHANYHTQFMIDTDGLSFAGDEPTPTNPQPISDVEGLTINFDNGVEEWNPMDGFGWIKRFLVSKSISISMTAKRNYGNKGNDYIASKYMKNGYDCYSLFIINFGNNDSLLIPCVIDVKSVGGETTGLISLEFDIVSHGKPVYKPAKPATI